MLIKLLLYTLSLGSLKKIDRYVCRVPFQSQYPALKVVNHGSFSKLFQSGIRVKAGGGFHKS